MKVIIVTGKPSMPGQRASPETWIESQYIEQHFAADNLSLSRRQAKPPQPPPAQHANLTPIAADNLSPLFERNSKLPYTSKSVLWIFCQGLENDFLNSTRNQWHSLA